MTVFCRGFLWVTQAIAGWVLAVRSGGVWTVLSYSCCMYVANVVHLKTTLRAQCMNRHLQINNPEGFVFVFVIIWHWWENVDSWYVFVRLPFPHFLLFIVRVWRYCMQVQKILRKEPQLQDLDGLHGLHVHSWRSHESNSLINVFIWHPIERLNSANVRVLDSIRK